MMTHIPNGELPKCTRPKTTFEECHAHSGENCMNAFQCGVPCEDAREFVQNIMRFVVDHTQQFPYIAKFTTKEAAALIEQRDARIRAEARVEAMRDDYRMDQLDAVMYSVDKWFDEGDKRLVQDPANRAADAREIALRKIEAIEDESAKKIAALKAELLDQTCLANGYKEIMSDNLHMACRIARWRDLLLAERDESRKEIAALIVGLSIPETHETRLPEEYAPIIATWANGRQTVSFRVGEFYYIDEGNGIAEQHAGTPKEWRYTE